MAIDAKKIVEKVEKAGSRTSHSLFLDKALMEAFKDECDRIGVKYSSIIEELIKDFMESSKKIK